MRVYTDLRCLQDPDYASRGIGRHCAALLRSVRQTVPEPVEVVGILDEQLPALPEEYGGLVDVRQFCLTPQPGRQTDIFFQPSPMTHDPSPLAPLLGRSRLRGCAFVYDFIPLDWPERYLPTPERRRAYLNNLFWLKYYQTFCALSHYTARRLRETLGTLGHAVEVVGGAVRDVFFRFNPRAAAGRPLACRFAPNRYFLAPGGHDRRKNVEAAVAAHARLIGRTGCPLGLVIVGHYLEDYQALLRQLFREHGGPDRQLEFVSGIPDEELARLYHHAIATICASRMEGFSLPVVEAIASGCPVLASSCEAQQELVDQPEALFGPDDTDRLSDLMERIWCEPSFRAGLLEQQRPVAPQFAEQQVAARFWRRVLRDLKPGPARRGPASRSDKPRVAFLTPYPPDRSGVAEYTAHSLQSLAAHATIDVYTDAQGVPEQPWVRRFAPLTEAPYVVDEYDRVVAVVGNSHFHTRVIDYHCRYGGACLAHDNRLAELYNWWRGPEKFTAMARRALGREVSVAESQSWLHDASQLPWTFFDEILAKADPLIVHSRGIQAHIAAAYGRQAQYLPFCCYRHFTDEELSEASRQEARQRLGLPQGRVAVITLGIISAHKGPLECLWALEHLRAWGVPADLYFVGTDQCYKAPLAEWTDRLQLRDHVHVLGDWVSDQVYRDFVLAADFAIQLRTHGFGGLSGAVLDCISAGLPTVVNEDMAAAMDGPSYVFRVPDNLSPTLIAEQLANAYEAGRHQTRGCPDRDAYVREHSFDNYARQMMQVLGLSSDRLSACPTAQEEGHDERANSV
jgi:glycosyltransferase involved in cell wall biosynthesis